MMTLKKSDNILLSRFLTNSICIQFYPQRLMVGSFVFTEFENFEPLASS